MHLTLPSSPPHVLQESSGPSSITPPNGRPLRPLLRDTNSTTNKYDKSKRHMPARVERPRPGRALDLTYTMLWASPASLAERGARLRAAVARRATPRACLCAGRAARARARRREVERAREAAGGLGLGHGRRGGQGSHTCSRLEHVVGHDRATCRRCSRRACCARRAERSEEGHGLVARARAPGGAWEAKHGLGCHPPLLWAGHGLRAVRGAYYGAAVARRAEPRACLCTGWSRAGSMGTREETWGRSGLLKRR